MTETAGGVTRAKPEDAKRYGTVGNLAQNLEAKIIDPESGNPLPPGKRGELWLRGPSIMKGYYLICSIVSQVLVRENRFYCPVSYPYFGFSPVK